MNEAIRTHLQTDNMWMVLITADAEGMKQLLLSGEPTPIEYPAPKEDWLLEEDIQITSFPIPVEADDIVVMGIDEVEVAQVRGRRSHSINRSLPLSSPVDPPSPPSNRRATLRGIFPFKKLPDPAILRHDNDRTGAPGHRPNPTNWTTGRSGYEILDRIETSCQS